MVHRLPKLLKEAEAQGVKYDWCVIMGGINDLGGCRTGRCAARGLVRYPARFGRALAAVRCGEGCRGAITSMLLDGWCAVSGVAGSAGVSRPLEVERNGPAGQAELSSAAPSCATFRRQHSRLRHCFAVTPAALSAH